jgi:hypothetical protein
MRPVLINHARRYPLWQVEDVYKLIHQAALGSEHALTGYAAARERLRREMAALSSGPEEPLIDPISPDGELVRVHLRSLARLRAGGDSLLEAFLRAPEVNAGSSGRVEAYAADAIHLARDGGLPFAGDDIIRFMARMNEAGFPAVHHSPVYRAAYRPTYRVAARALLPPAWLSAGE